MLDSLIVIRLIRLIELISKKFTYLVNFGILEMVDELIDKVVLIAMKTNYG